VEVGCFSSVDLIFLLSFNRRVTDWCRIVEQITSLDKRWNNRYSNAVIPEDNDRFSL
jgi:hypothetical protein